MQVTQRFTRLAGLAADESVKSTLCFKHGAIIYKGGKKICAGYNQNTRTTYRKNICCSVHAEMDTVTKFLNSFIKIHSTKNPNKIRRKLNKFSICVVRSQENSDGDLYYLNSMPCIDCMNKLKHVGLKNIIYTGDNRTIQTARLSKFDINELKFCGVMKHSNVLELMRVVPLI
jgi:deoxycytidylate deaminase